MHRIYSAIIILAVTIAVIMFGFTINTTTSRSVSDKVELAESYAVGGDTVNAKNAIKAAVSEWQGKMETMLIFVSHGRLDQIEESLNKANPYIEFGELKAFSAECRKVKILIKHFYDLEYPTINNIL